MSIEHEKMRGFEAQEERPMTTWEVCAGCRWYWETLSGEQICTAYGEPEELGQEEYAMGICENYESKTDRDGSDKKI